MMKWKKFYVKAKATMIWLSAVAMEQTALNFYIPGVYRREWKCDEGGNIEIITIAVRDSLTDIYELSVARTKLVPYNEQLVHNVSPEIFLATYNALTKQLLENGGPRVYSFLVAENILLINKQAFAKVSGESFK